MDEAAWDKPLDPMSSEQILGRHFCKADNYISE